jgi:MYXO-CTERM domain-containing protein
MLMDTPEADHLMRNLTRLIGAAFLAGAPAMAQAQADVGGTFTSGAYIGTAGDSLLLDGSGSDTSDCKKAYFSWGIKHMDGLYASIETSPTTAETYTLSLEDYDGETTFAVELTMLCRIFSDEDGTSYVELSTDSGTIEVLNANPEIESLEYESPIYEGDEVEITISVTDPEPDDELHITWEFSDGESGEGEQVIRSFPDDGLYFIEVSALDDDDGSDTRSFELYITNLAPEIDCSAEEEVWVGDMWSLTPSATDPGEDTLSWNMEPMPSTAYFDYDTGDMTWWPGKDEEGTHSFVLTVSDEDGGSDSIDLTVEVLFDHPIEDTDNGDEGGHMDRDSGQPSEGAEVNSSDSQENIGCGCSSNRSPEPPWRWAILLTAFAGLRRRH